MGTGTKGKIGLVVSVESMGMKKCRYVGEDVVVEEEEDYENWECGYWYCCC